MKFITGGSDSKQQAQNTSQSGFSLLPTEMQVPYKQYGTQLSDLFKSPQTAAFTPMQATAGENKAISSMYGGYTPTQQSLQSDIAMQMNPYDESVIGTINREAQGQGSVLNNLLNKAGQFGSNRATLGANDIDLTRLNQIGSFKQNMFQSALDNAMKTMPALRQASDQAAMGAGSFERGMDTQTKQAPMSALQSYGSMLGVLPTNGGATSQGTSNSETSSQNGMSDKLIGAGVSMAAKYAPLALSFLSDERLKEGIIKVGVINGHNYYMFSYLDDPTRYLGVIAQEVEKTHPEAVSEHDGYKAVNYEMIGVPFSKVIV